MNHLILLKEKNVKFLVFSEQQGVFVFSVCVCVCVRIALTQTMTLGDSQFFCLYDHLTNPNAYPWSDYFYEELKVAKLCVYAILPLYMRCLWYNGYHCRNYMVTQVQILDKAVCISHHINTLAKGMIPTSLSPVMCK